MDVASLACGVICFGMKAGSRVVTHHYFYRLCGGEMTVTSAFKHVMLSGILSLVVHEQPHQHNVASSAACIPRFSPY